MKHRAQQFELPIVEVLHLVSEGATDGERIMRELRDREAARRRHEAEQPMLFAGPVFTKEAK